MLDFIQRILSLKSKALTVLLWEDQTPDETETYRVKPARLLGMFAIINSGVVLLVLLFFFLTPLGSMLFNTGEQATQRQIIDIRNQIESLRDSLHASETQLSHFRRALAQSRDTTFVTSLSGTEADWSEFEDTFIPESDIMLFRDYIAGFQADQIIFSHEMSQSEGIEFPLPFPVEGSVTRTFDTSKGHPGIDIATAEGTYIRAFADGVVVFTGWTVNYGYVLIKQHENGYLSTYKHCQSLLKKKGDIVQKGDIIGRVGSYGLISSGPHLHFELWQDGIPLDPALFFIQL